MTPKKHTCIRLPQADIAVLRQVQPASVAAAITASIDHWRAQQKAAEALYQWLQGKQEDNALKVSQADLLFLNDILDRITAHAVPAVQEATEESQDQAPPQEEEEAEAAW
jgi:hypothetical protein